MKRQLQFESISMVSDDELLRRLRELSQQSRRLESELVAHIGEVDQRRLYAREASSSMFSYSTEVLHLSEAEAYLRIEVAPASRKHPMLLEMLGDGRLHLSGIASWRRTSPRPIEKHFWLERLESLKERSRSWSPSFLPDRMFRR